MRHLNGLIPRVYTATTDGNGVATFTVPAGRLNRYDGAVAVPVASVSLVGRLTAQIATEPNIGANLWTSGGTITVAVSAANVITTVLVQAGAPGLVAAGSGITVRCIVWGC